MKQSYCLLIVLVFFESSFLNLEASFAPWYSKIKDQKMLRFKDYEILALLEKTKREVNVVLSSIANKFIITDNQSLRLNGFRTLSSIDELSPSAIKDGFFIVFFQTDDDYFYTLKKIKDGGGTFYSLPFYGPKTRYVWTDKNAMRAIDETFSFGSKVSHLTLEVHETICQCLNITKNLPGDYVEIGVYKGGSALTAIHYMKFAEIDRNSYFLDTFNGMTYEEAHNSSDKIWDNTHQLWGIEETMKYVGDLLKTTGLPYRLVESNICRDSLPAEIKKIAVCNLDVDLYDPTIAALEKVAPLVVKGGIIICEDPTSTPTLGGALLAMEEFLMTEMGKKFIKILAGAQYVLIKIND